MKGISVKLASSAAVGSVVAIIVWIASLFHFIIPPEIAVALAVLIGALVGYQIPESAVYKGATVNVVANKVDNVQ